jgi:hypothetical protein
MKCIKSIKATKNTEIGVITRIDDKEAELKVKGGYWSYIPKSEWKEYKGNSKKTETVTQEVTDQESSQVKARRGKRANAK